jgi:hypothetical protein
MHAKMKQARALIICGTAGAILDAGQAAEASVPATADIKGCEDARLPGRRISSSDHPLKASSWSM